MGGLPWYRVIAIRDGPKRLRPPDMICLAKAILEPPSLRGGVLHGGTQHNIAKILTEKRFDVRDNTQEYAPPGINFRPGFLQNMS